jgi:hypothetical protein
MSDVADFAILEGLGILVDGEAFVQAGLRIAFDTIVRVEVRVKDTRGTLAKATARDPAGTAWREFLVDVVLVTDDRIADPRLLGLGARTYGTDGSAPELDWKPLTTRARRVAEAASHICGKPMIA